MMASSSLPIATAVPACKDEEDEAQEVKNERGEDPSLLLPHEQIRQKTKLLKTINWANDLYELCIEKRAEEQSGSLFVVFLLGETSSGKKFSCAISDKEQASLHLREGAPLGLCVMESLYEFMEDAFVSEKPELSVSLPEFLESPLSSVSLTVSYDNGLSGYAAVQFQVQVYLALVHNPSETELTRMMMEKKVGVLQDQVTEEARALREEVSSLREMVGGLSTELSTVRGQICDQVTEEATALREEVSSLREMVGGLSIELSTLRGQVQQFQQLSYKMFEKTKARVNCRNDHPLVIQYAKDLAELQSMKI